MSKKLVLVADFHEGHRVGLADPSLAPTTDAGAKVREAIYEKYYECAAGQWHSPDLLAIVGDAIDGKGKRGGGVEQWDTSVRNQAIRAAALARLWDAKQYIVIRGSGYHCAESGEYGEEIMAQELKAMTFPHQEHIDPKLRDRSGWDAYIIIGGVTFHLAHQMPVSKVFHYRSTPITREMMYTKLNDGLAHAKEELSQNLMEAGVDPKTIDFKTRNIIRAHCHFYWESASARTLGIVLPCWQALTPYMRGKSPTAISSDIGFVGFEVEGGKILRRHKQLWQLEQVQKPPVFVILE